jgi:predicted acylesterase/phospholipase RssA
MRRINAVGNHFYFQVYNMIEHLVISSAGPNGLIQLGMLQQLQEESTLNVTTLKSIHGSSAGSILGVLIALRIPIQEVVDYFIQRPLGKWFKVEMEQLFTHKGIVSSSCFEELLTPFFHAYDIPLTITMNELHKRTGIDIHIYTTSVTHMCSVVINSHTFPELPVIQAISMSSAIPFLVTPIMYKDEYYVDGGLMKHCPVPDVDPDTILVVLMVHKIDANLESPMDFMQHILVKIFDILSSNTVTPEGKFVYVYNTPISSIRPYNFGRVLVDSPYREEMIEAGKQCISNRGDKLPI